MNEITIKYDGSYPNLCRGHLVITVNGKVWDFGSYCLHSGGSVRFDKNWMDHVESGEWSVDFPNNFPKKYKEDVLEAINDKIPHGCCGGCV